MQFFKRSILGISILEYILITLGAFLYSISTLLFIFPHGLLLGGTSGISVILNSFLNYSTGTILTAINAFLIILAFILLGKEMGAKTLVGSILTTVTIWVLERFLVSEVPVISNYYLSAAVGASIIAIASGIMFYVDSSSGGTDVIALILQKFTKIQIGKALLFTDILIVIIGGILSGLPIFLGSFSGLLIKTFGIDFVIGSIKKYQK